MSHKCFFCWISQGSRLHLEPLSFFPQESTARLIVAICDISFVLDSVLVLMSAYNYSLPSFIISHLLFYTFLYIIMPSPWLWSLLPNRLRTALYRKSCQTASNFNFVFLVSCSFNILPWGSSLTNDHHKETIFKMIFSISPLLFFKDSALRGSFYILTCSCPFESLVEEFFFYLMHTLLS